MKSDLYNCISINCGQVFYNRNVWDKIQSMQGWKNKLGAIVKGPSWLPGKPWTGADEDKIDVSNLIIIIVTILLSMNNQSKFHLGKNIVSLS